jgi:hypothetical protein
MLKLCIETQQDRIKNRSDAFIRKDPSHRPKCCAFIYSETTTPKTPHCTMRRRSLEGATQCLIVHLVIFTRQSRWSVKSTNPPFQTAYELLRTLNFDSKLSYRDFPYGITQTTESILANGIIISRGGDFRLSGNSSDFLVKKGFHIITYPCQIFMHSRAESKNFPLLTFPVKKE